MTLSAVISSSQPFIDGFYQITGGVANPVTIIIQNSSSQPVTLKDVYLTCENGAVSLGDPVFKRRGTSYAPANNVIPAATTTTTSGSVPVPSGSNDSGSWIIFPFQDTFTIGTPPLEQGPYHENIGYWAFSYQYNPPFYLPVTTQPNSQIGNPALSGAAASPIVSGSPPVPVPFALNVTSAQYVDVFDTGGGPIEGQLGMPIDPPNSSSLANEFTYEWWSYLRSYGVPVILAAPTIGAGKVWKTFGFPFIEGVGAEIGYTTDGKLYCMMESDFVAVLPEGEVNAPPYVGLTSSAIVPLNTWVHQAVTRNGAGQLKFWIAGVDSGGGSRPIAQNAHYLQNYALFCDNLVIPNLEEGPYYYLVEGTPDGWFTQLRFSPSTLYTGGFTPPTGAFSASYNSGGGSIPVTSSVTTLGTASYPALIVPQVLPVSYFPENRWSFNLSAVVMRGSDPAVIVSETAQFMVTGAVNEYL